MTAVSKHWRIICLFLFCCFTSYVAPLHARADATYSSHFRKDILPLGVFDSESMGKIVCSLAGSHPDSCPSEFDATRHSVQLAPSAPPPTADIEIDQFSMQRFGQIGFTPQCLFVDQSSPQGYLETKIAKTLDDAPNPIYRSDQETRAVKPRELDAYWEYYADCDAWNVVFAGLPDSISTPVSVTSQIQPNVNWYRQATGHLHALESRIHAGWQRVVEEVRWLEFKMIEMKNVPVSTPVSTPTPAQDILIDAIKSVQPMVEGMIDNQFVQNPSIWIDNLRCRWESEVSKLGLQPVLTSFNQVQYLGTVGVHEDLRLTSENVWSERISWIAERIERVVDRISTR